jgi:DNA-directed RNA polymerase specialized sigma24 family protein
MPEGAELGASIEELLLAEVVLHIADREERASGSQAVRTEVLLVDAGLSLSTAARLTGKNYETVKTAVRRARSKTPTRGSNQA